MVDGSLKGRALVDVVRELEVMRELVLLFLGDFVCDQAQDQDQDQAGSQLCAPERRNKQPHM